MVGMGNRSLPGCSATIALLHAHMVIYGRTYCQTPLRREPPVADVLDVCASYTQHRRTGRPQQAFRADRRRLKQTAEDVRGTHMFDRLLGRSGPSVPNLGPRDAWERYSSAPGDTVLIDVREAWEFSRGHAKGARNIPLSAFTGR